MTIKRTTRMASEHNSDGTHAAITATTLALTGAATIPVATSGGTWDLVTEETIATSSTSFTNVTGLTGNTAIIYKFLLQMKYATASATTTYLRLNGDSANNYGYQYVQGQNITAQANRNTSTSGLFLGTNSSTDDAEILVEGKIYAKSGMVRRAIITEHRSTTLGTTINYVSILASAWNNTANEITSMQVVNTVADSFDSGYFALWKMKH